MYKYVHPKPIAIKLDGDQGFDLRQKAAAYLAENINITGAERGSVDEQGFGVLAEIVIRSKLGMSLLNPLEHPVGYDILLPSGIKLDVKCRGGEMPFREIYESSDGIGREAKHNFFARQVYDDLLDADAYLMTHLETPSKRSLPGTNRQRKWTLFVCGWVSKERVAREGVYLPRGSLTEQGRTWFTYRGQEIEFYNQNLNGLENICDLLEIDVLDVEIDNNKQGSLNLTSVDAIRIAYDLIGRGVLTEKHMGMIAEFTKLNEQVRTVKPILHSNQYFHLLKWLRELGAVTDSELEKTQKLMQEVPFTGI